MSFDFSSLIWVFFAIMLLQPLFTGRWYTVRRAQAIRAIERGHAYRVITMIHRQEKRSLFGFAMARHRERLDPGGRHRHKRPQVAGCVQPSRRNWRARLSHAFQGPR